MNFGDLMDFVAANKGLIPETARVVFIGDGDLPAYPTSIYPITDYDRETLAVETHILITTD